MTWTVLLTPEFEAWLNALPGDDRLAIAQDIGVLEAVGPHLGRPYVDHIKGSRHQQMKELRTRHGNHQYRSLFAFDPKRNAIILIGGDKAGADQRRFYESVIAQADALYDRHVRALSEKKPTTRKGRS
jgi:hypothetical protein